MEKIKIGISYCLLGERVRHDAGHQLDRYITDTLGQYFEWAPVCPEVEYGLPVPREPMRLVGDIDSPRLITVRTGIDHTEWMLKWAEKKLEEIEKEELCGFIFKSRSPSSGIGGVKVYTPYGMPSQKGIGLFGRALMDKFPVVPVIVDGRRHDPGLRENFIERVFVYKRWQEFIKKGGLIRDLVAFHTEHKLLILSHSPKHFSVLGRLVAKPALALAVPGHTRIVHLYVVPDFWDGMQDDDWLNNAWTRDAFARHVEGQLETDAKADAEALAQRCASRGLACVSLVRYGDPAK